jgi:glucosamine-6-phosphate deaminase
MRDLREQLPGLPANVQVLVGDKTQACAAAVRELERALARGARPLVSFATGRTFAAFYAAVARAAAAARPGLSGMRATHLDEYLGFRPDQPGGMVHELLTACPPLRELHERGAFLAVPADGSAAAIAAHEQALADAGGVALQFLGIGRNGHIAFNEPGTSFDLGFHRATLASATRADARARFQPDEPPLEAVTAGPRSILAARRLVLLAFGATKAPAVRAMLLGPIEPACPASIVRRHGDALVLLDAESAGGLARSGPGAARG